MHWNANRQSAALIYINTTQKPDRGLKPNSNKQPVICFQITYNLNPRNADSAHTAFYGLSHINCLHPSPSLQSHHHTVTGPLSQLV